MGKQSYWNLMIMCVVAMQGIVLSSAENMDASSPLLLRQKRASSSSHKGKDKLIERTASLSIPENRGGYLHPPLPDIEVGMYNPGRWEGRLDPGMVRIYRGSDEIGIGVVAHPRVFVTKAHFIPNEFHLGEFHVEYSDINGDTIRQVIEYGRKKIQLGQQEIPWGKDDVCYLEISVHEDMPVAKPVSAVLKKSRIFTLKQIIWIASQTGCYDSPNQFI